MSEREDSGKQEYSEAAAKVYARLIEGVVLLLLLVSMLIASLYILATRPARKNQPIPRSSPAGMREGKHFHVLQLVIVPASFEFQGKAWRIELVPLCHTDGRSNKNYLGMSHFDTHVIEVRNDLSGADQAETLYHELEHVATGQEFPLERMKGHEAIYRLEPMADLLGENPALGKYLREAYR